MFVIVSVLATLVAFAQLSEADCRMVDGRAVSCTVERATLGAYSAPAAHSVPGPGLHTQPTGVLRLGQRAPSLNQQPERSPLW